MNPAGVIFCTDEVEVSMKLYHSLFGWEILVSTPNHGEMLFSTGENSAPLDNLPIRNFGKLFWSPRRGVCPMEPGNLVINVEKDFSFPILNEKKGEPSISQAFSQVYRDPKNLYECWMDQWSNRIWFYRF